MTNDSIFPGYNPPSLPQGMESMNNWESPSTIQNSFLTGLSTPSFGDKAGYAFDSIGSGYDSFKDWGKGIFGGSNADGSSKLWGSGGIAGGLGSILGGAGGIAGAVMAGKQAKLGRDIFDFQRGSYNENNRLTAQGLNRQIADRQVADIAQQGLSTYTARRGDPAQYRDDNKVTPRKV